jgi:hypothetical protein
MNSWELIFLQSRVNYGRYDGDSLPVQNWDWPEGTWFQQRLLYFRGSQRRLFQKSVELESTGEYGGSAAAEIRTQTALGPAISRTSLTFSLGAVCRFILLKTERCSLSQKL